MAKITNAGSGFIEYEGRLMNLKEYKKIEPYEFSILERENNENTCSIYFTPLKPSKENIENGVEGAFHISYQRKEERDDDFQVIQEALAI